MIKNMGVSPYLHFEFCILHFAFCSLKHAQRVSNYNLSFSSIFSARRRKSRLLAKYMVSYLIYISAFSSHSSRTPEGNSSSPSQNWSRIRRPFAISWRSIKLLSRVLLLISRRRLRCVKPIRFCPVRRLLSLLFLTVRWFTWMLWICVVICTPI